MIGYNDHLNVAMGNWLRNGGTSSAIDFDTLFNYELSNKSQGAGDNSIDLINLFVSELESLINRYSKENEACDRLSLREQEFLGVDNPSLNQIMMDGEKKAYEFVIKDIEDLIKKFK